MKVQIPEYHGDTWYEIPCTFAQEAAEIAAEQYEDNSAEYNCVKGNPITVHVDDGYQVSTWRVECEAVLHYYATEKQGCP